jgi:hypothetical protein
MFVRHAEPVSLTQMGLEGLCVSLNRPVVEIDPLPAGPARAAIALHRSADGERCLFVAVCAVESRVVALFVFGGHLRSVNEAMEEGLSFAEPMGFLFDDDMLRDASGAADAVVEPAASRRALECWCELLGEDPPLETESVVEPDADPILDVGEVEPIDLLDDDTAVAGDDELDDMVDLFDPELEERVPLSKFRPEPEAPDPLGESTTLGRVAIVRRRVSEDGHEIPDFATRLLASF